MPEITFVFGPDGSFFFDCPKTWKFHGIPQSLRQLFNSSMSANWRIAQPYCVALAPAPKSFKLADPLWYAGCKTLSGEDKLFYTEKSFETTYPDLVRWMKGLSNAPRSCFVTFGQNLSYFACAADQGSIWGGIPSELEDTVRKVVDMPTFVCLGKHNAWLVLYPNGYIAWKFHGHYSALHTILNNTAPQSIAYVALSPYNKEHYFIAFKDRSIKYNFKGAPKEWMILMTEVFKSWATEPMPSQPPPLAQPNYQAPPRYYPEQQYPQGQAWQQPQSYHQQVQVAYNQNSPAQYPAHLAGYHNVSGMPSPAPSYHSPVPQHAMPSPAPSYHSPVPQHMIPNSPQWSGPPQPPPVELPASLPVDLPAELPGDFSPADPASVPSQKTATEKKRKSLFKLF
ncbi:hypothetical protein HBH70_001910 [Parastagonospora nodorum]|nr:hypothetical protein HBH52_150880 [Parastagonospora nodorum]KAH4005344.1 hypothetical protein HBI10_036910 [Parastagonospora nodorum]KAH4032805.1 hypothetical protein HBI13_002260 [Parastagonospora nodorum]KAH4072781.1 hypothetical protein HBH50_064090 [Parastagonospora nodorum]KAH4099068.1 hypothetical protein HBH48_002270 [Parastagonospora nodorum]